jgi:hypothetical protein
MPPKRKAKVRRKQQQYEWLPVDERLLPDIFSFGYVKGISKVFLSIEIVCVFFVVLGTLVLAVLKLVS